MNHDNFIGREKALNNLQECFRSKLSDLDPLEDGLEYGMVMYALDTIDVHRNIYKLEYEHDLDKMAKEVKDGRN